MKECTIVINNKPFTFQSEVGDKYDFHHMEPEDGERILDLTAKLLNACEVPFFLAFGTLLGAVREGYFIKGDEDVDIIITDEDKLYQCIPYLYEHGLLINRIYRGALYSFHTEDRKGHIDLYVLREFQKSIWKRRCFCIHEKAMPKKYFRHIETGAYTLGGNQYPYPQNPETLLEWWYGKDWRIPQNKKGRYEVLSRRIWKFPRQFFWKQQRRIKRIIGG